MALTESTILPQEERVFSQPIMLELPNKTGVVAFFPIRGQEQAGRLLCIYPSDTTKGTLAFALVEGDKPFTLGRTEGTKLISDDSKYVSRRQIVAAPINSLSGTFGVINDGSNPLERFGPIEDLHAFPSPLRPRTWASASLEKQPVKLLLDNKTYDIQAVNGKLAITRLDGSTIFPEDNRAIIPGPRESALLLHDNILYVFNNSNFPATLKRK